MNKKTEKKQEEAKGTKKTAQLKSASLRLQAKKLKRNRHSESLSLCHSSGRQESA